MPVPNELIRPMALGNVRGLGVRALCVIYRSAATRLTSTRVAS